MCGLIPVVRVNSERFVASPADNRRGILAMMAAMALFIGNDTFLKLASDAYPAGQMMALRGIFAIVLSLGLVVAFGAWRSIPLLADRRVIGRALLEGAVAFTFMTALARMPLAIITAILQATPIVITLLTVILRIEPVGWRRWAAIIVGFAGVLLVIRPSMEGVDFFVLMALVCAFLIAFRDLMTRNIAKAVPSTIITLASTLSVAACGLLASLSGMDVIGWQPVQIEATLYLAGAAIFVTAGNVAIIAAFRGTDLSVVSPFRYSVIVWAIIMGFIVFGEWPDVVASAGIALIVVSGLYTVHRERVRARAARTAVVGPQP